MIYNLSSDKFIPAILEIETKIPYIVDEDANIENTVKKLLDAKIRNLGQWNISPDIVLVHNKIINKFNDCIIRYAND